MNGKNDFGPNSGLGILALRMSESCPGRAMEEELRINGGDEGGRILSRVPR